MLEDNLIVLREFQEHDLVKWTSWFNDEGITRYMNKGVFPNTLAQQKEHLRKLIAENNNIQLAIDLKDDEELILIGLIGLHNIDWIHRTAAISILIGEDEGRGKGMGTKAIKLLVNHAFRKMNLRKINAGMWSKNIASKKAFEANGFNLEGVKKEEYFCENNYLDSLDYGLLKKEWKKINN
jgi:[ribosomal protein S5]-alanine N-acetyltransferase